MSDGLFLMFFCKDCRICYVDEQPFLQQRLGRIPKAKTRKKHDSSNADGYRYYIIIILVQ